jgi:hypothetical protein
MDSTISFDAPFRLDFLRSPRLAASAAPAAICCFFDLAGILFNRRASKKRIYPFQLFVNGIMASRWAKKATLG